MVGKHGIQIWFFIGSLLLIYGVAIFIANVYEWISPPETSTVVLGNLHFGVWWGFLLIGLGLLYVVRFMPKKKT